MSQEKLPVNVEVPGPLRYKFAKWYQGPKVRDNIKLSVDGLEHIPRTGAVSAIANHRNRKWDIPILGWAISDIRTPFYPAKKKYGQGKLGLNGFVMRGSGALFFDEDKENERAAVVLKMSRHLRVGHMVLTLPEGTSRLRGQELGDLEPGALEIALRADLSQMILMGLGGTETSSGLDEDEETMPTKVHLEIDSLDLTEAQEDYAGTPKKERKDKVFDLTERIVRPALQDVIDIAYEKIAA